MTIYLFLIVALSCAALAQDEQWQTKQFGIGVDLSDVEVFNNSIYVSGGPMLFRSNDAGRTWDTLVIKSEGKSVKSMTLAFPSALVGYSSDTAVFKTTDGGQSWFWVATIKSNHHSNSSYFTTISFVDADNGVGIGPDRTYMRTMDAGKTWSTFIATCVECNDVQLLTPEIGFLGGYEYDAFGSRGTFAKWDQALNPHFIPMPNFVKQSRDFEIRDIHVLNLSTWWIAGLRQDEVVGYSAHLSFTMDGGVTYNEPMIEFPSSITAVSFRNSVEGIPGT